MKDLSGLDPATLHELARRVRETMQPSQIAHLARVGAGLLQLDTAVREQCRRQVMEQRGELDAKPARFQVIEGGR